MNIFSVTYLDMATGIEVIYFQSAPTAFRAKLRFVLLMKKLNMEYKIISIR